MSEMARAMARGSRAKTRSARVGFDTRGSALPSQQLPRNHEALDLAGALADRTELHVAEVLLRRVVLHEAVSAMDLHAFLRGPHRDLARVELGDRRGGGGARDFLI